MYPLRAYSQLLKMHVPKCTKTLHFSTKKIRKNVRGMAMLPPQTIPLVGRATLQVPLHLDPGYAGAAYMFIPELKSTMALRQLYSAESTCIALSFSTCSWKMRMWSMNATTRSAAIGLACSPAAASRGATCSGIEHCAAFSMNNSLHDSRSNPT